MKFIIPILICFSLVLGCSKSPKEYPRENPPGNDYRPNVVPNLESPLEVLTKPLPEEASVGGKEYDEKVKLNSSQPILYAKGAAGISFKTTLTESRKVLSVPRYGPDVNGTALYDESMIIRWRLDEPQTPEYFLLDSGYLGRLDLGNGQSIGLNHDFSKKYPVNTKEGAERIARDLYRIFHKEEASFDCLPKGFCSVDWGTEEKKDAIISFPGLLLLMSKDRFVVYRILVQKINPQGLFANNADILTGSVLVPDQKPISLGDEYQDVFKRQSDEVKKTSGIDLEIETDVSTDSFGQNYTGVYVVFNKTKFDRTAKLPEPTDKLMMYQFGGDWKGLLTLDGQPMTVVESSESVDLLVGDNPAMKNQASKTQAVVSGTQRFAPLQISLGLRRSNVRGFAEKLNKFIGDALRSKYPQAEIFARVSGQHLKKEIKEYTGYNIVFDKSSGNGSLVQFKISEERGNFVYFLVRQIGNQVNAYDPVIYGNMTTPVEKVIGPQPVLGFDNQPMMGGDGKPLVKYETLPYFTTLSGFTIGDVVRVTDWDLGRQEATTEMQIDGKSVTARSRYLDVATLQVAYTTEKVVVQDQAFVTAGSVGVELGLKLVQGDDKQRIYKIISIGSSFKENEIKDLCKGKLVPRFGMSDVQFLEEIKNIKDCAYLPVYDTGGNGRLTSVYFPNDRLRLSFSEQDLSMARVYFPASEVQ
ncbi:MAG: hypothetical protein K2Q26_06360 [Bdellovibrionales bacterium]|nr:hypothetical protein [Bdellovibrionales bacterium]